MAAYPTSPSPSVIEIKSLQPTFVSVSTSLKRQARSKGAQRFGISLKYAPMTREDFSPLFGFVMGQQGQYGTFTIVPPVHGTTNSSATGIKYVNNVGGYAKGVKTITIDGGTGTLAIGDFIKFDTHDKVYVITAAATTSLTFEPGLVAAISNDDEVIYSVDYGTGATDGGVKFTAALSSDSVSFVRQAHDSHSFSIDMVEVA